MRRNRALLLLSVCPLLLAASVALAAKAIETFDAVGVKMGAGATSRITITIERWSTDAERQALLDILREKGQDGLVQALFKMPRAGFIRLPNTRGYDLKYARSIQNPDGSRTVVVASDRAITYRELTTASRSKNYDFAFAEMKFPKDGGKGEGKLAPASQISIDKATNQIEIENYSAQPVRLMGITSKKP